MARWLSLWLLTETYSPRAMETAPPTSPARPAVRMGPVLVVTPATPTTMAATETMPSLAPSTPARSQLRRCAMSLRWGSFSWVVISCASLIIPANHSREWAASKVRMS